MDESQDQATNTTGPASPATSVNNPTTDTGSDSTSQPTTVPTTENVSVESETPTNPVAPPDPETPESPVVEPPSTNSTTGATAEPATQSTNEADRALAGDPDSTAVPGQPVDNPALAQVIAGSGTPSSPQVTSGGVDTMVALDSLYNDTTALLHRVEAAGLSVAHNDVNDLVEALNIARTWLAQKLTVYNPEHAVLLRNIPSSPGV